MATSVFTWEGKTRQGTVQKGEIAANSKEDVLALLRKQNIQPINVTAKPKEIKLSFGAPKVKDKDIVIFTRQLATMIDAGLPLVQCLDILGSQTENKTLAKDRKPGEDRCGERGNLCRCAQKTPQDL